MSRDAFDLDYACAQSPHAQGVGVSENYAVEPWVNSPILAYDWVRGTDGSGDTLWVNRGSAGAGGDATGTGGAGNAAALGDGPGYSMDGGDSFTIPFSTSSTSHSFLFWAASTQAVQGKIFDASAGRLIIPWADNSGKLGYYDGAWRTFSNRPNDGIPHQIAVILNSATSKGAVFVDAVQDGAEQAYTSKALGGTVRIGRSTSAAVDFFTGDLYSLHYYDCALSAAQINDLFQRQRHIFGV